MAWSSRDELSNALDKLGRWKAVPAHVQKAAEDLRASGLLQDSKAVESLRPLILALKGFYSAMYDNQKAPTPGPTTPPPPSGQPPLPVQQAGPPLRPWSPVIAPPPVPKPMVPWPADYDDGIHTPFDDLPPTSPARVQKSAPELPPPPPREFRPAMAMSQGPPPPKVLAVHGEQAHAMATKALLEHREAYIGKAKKAVHRWMQALHDNGPREV